MENTVIKPATPLAEKGRAAIAFLQANEGKHSGQAIVDGAGDILNVRGVHAVMNGLFKRELVGKEKADLLVLDKDGNEVTKNLTVYFLTDAGIAFDVEDLTK